MLRQAIVVAATAALVAACAAPDGTPAPQSYAAPSPPASTAAPSPSASPTHTHPDAPAPSGTLRPGESWLTLGVADALPDGVYAPQAPAGGTDDYRCFLVDPELVRDSAITGVAFIPGTPAVVHHSILFRVEPAQVAAAVAKDAADPRPGWECFGGPGLPSTSTNPIDSLDSAPWLAAWAPGGRESLFPSGYGVPLTAGSRIVVQMHYNLRSVSGPDAADSTHVRLRLTSRSVAPLRTMLLPGPVELPCPDGSTDGLCSRSVALAEVAGRFGPQAGRTVAGLQLLCGGNPILPRAGSVQQCTRRIRSTTTVLAVAGHMHLLGRSITVVANKGTPRERTLLSIPVWDFDDQSARPLARPARLATGDTVTVTCRHDATLRQKLPALAGTPERYVVWGEGTTDEMCLGILITS